MKEFASHRVAEEASRGRSYKLAQVLKDYFTVFVGHSGSAFLGFLTSVILARFLTKEDFGIYSAFVAFVIIFAYLVDLGISQSFVRFGSILHARREIGALTRMGAAAIRSKILTGAGIGVSGGIILAFTSIGEELGDAWLVLLIPIGGLVLSFFYLLNGILQIRRLFRKVSLLMMFKAAVLMTLAALALASGLRNPLIYCSIFVVAGVISLIAFSGQIRSIAPRSALKDSRIHKEINTLLHFGKWIAVSSMSFAIFEQIPVTAALAFFGPSDVALISVGLAFVASLHLLNAPLLTVLVPDLSRISTQRDLRNYFVTIYRILIPSAMLILVPALYFSESIITLFYGESYADSALIFSMLLVPFVLVFATLPLTSAMIYVFDKPRTPALVNMVQLLLLLAFIMTIGSSMNIYALTATYCVIRGGGTVLVAALTLLHLHRWK